MISVVEVRYRTLEVFLRGGTGRSEMNAILVVDLYHNEGKGSRLLNELIISLILLLLDKQDEFYRQFIQKMNAIEI